MVRFLSLLIAWMSFLLVAEGQTFTSKSPFVLNIDYARFRHTDKEGYLELYYGFYPGLMTYEFKDGKFRGGTLLTTTLSRKETGERIIHESVVLPMIIDDTSSTSLRSTFVTQGGYSVPFGEYVLSVRAADSLAPDRKDSVSLPIQIQPYAATINVSDVEMCSNLKSSDDKTDPFYKNSVIVVPNPTLVFGATTAPVLFNYAELYNINPDSTYTVKTVVVDTKEKVNRESSKTRKYGVKSSVEIGMINTTSILSGRYRFQLVVLDGSAKEVARTSKTFYVYNPHLQVPQASTASLKATELVGFTAEELADEFRRAQYVATDQEIRTFSEVSSVEGRRDLLAQLWSEVEAGRLGNDPIKRSEYLQRVGVANRQYRALSKEGWRTDRGRVYVLYGEPDEIERHPNTQDNKPYEIWNYYRLENGVVFVFIDRSGFGEYILFHSTKRGELRDDQWQRFLQ